MPAAKRITKSEFRAALNRDAESLIAALRSRIPDDCGDRVMLEYRDTAIEYQLALHAVALATDRHKHAALEHASEVGMRFVRAKVALQRWSDARQMGCLAVWPAAPKDEHEARSVSHWNANGGGSA